MSKFKERQQAVSNGSHGLVIGSSIAGLLAARVLLNHFESVTIVERDSLPAQPGLRSGVAQTVHSHGLLKRGSNILELLFPGFAQVLQSPWQRATSEDRSWLSPMDTTSSQQLSWIDRFVKRYWQEFALLLKNNPEVYRNSQESRHMVRTSTTFSNLKFPLAIAKQVLQRKIANYISTSKLERSPTSHL